MLKRTRIVVIEIVVACLAVMVALLFWVSHYIDTPEFKESLIEVVEGMAGVPVTIDGDLDVALYPDLSLQVTGLTLGGSEEFGDAPLAMFDTVRVGAHFMPLWDGRIDLTTLEVEGMTLNVIESKKGVFNWQQAMQQQAQLIESDGTGGSGIKRVTLNGLDISDTTVNYKNLHTGDTFSLRGLTLHIGDVSPEKTVPFEIVSAFSWDSHGVEASFSFNGALGVTPNEGGLYVSDAKVLASVGGIFLPEGVEPASLQSSVNVDLRQRIVTLEDLRIGFLGAVGKGTFITAPLDGDLKVSGQFFVEEFNPASVLRNYVPMLDIEEVDGLNTCRLDADISLTEDGVALPRISLTLDDQTIQGDVHVKGYTNSALSFNLQANKVDLDRYLPMFGTGSDAPTLWEDVPLELANWLKGQGTAQLGELKVAGSSIRDIKASLDGLGQALVLDVTGTADKGGKFTSHGEVKITRINASEAPTLATSFSLSATGNDGFGLLEGGGASIQGSGRFQASLQTAPIVCAPDKRAMDIFRNLSGNATLLLGKGGGSYGENDNAVSFKYDKTEFAITFVPADLPTTDYGFDANFSLKGHANGPVKAYSLSAKGLVGLFYDKLHSVSPGLGVRSHVSTTLLTDKPIRISLNGQIKYDTEKNTLSVADAILRTLETTARGSMDFSDLDEKFKGVGHLEIPSANAKRITYLLTQYIINTEDNKALKQIKLKSDVSLDAKDFHFTNISGELDGMELSGRVSGKWEKNPRLLANLKAGEFDLDRYLPPSNADENAVSEPVELPLTFFRMLNLDGMVRFKEFKLIKTRTRALSGTIRAKDGKIHVLKVTGRMNKGRLTGDWVGLIRERDLTTDLSLRINNMDGAAFMKSVAGRDYVRGKTDMSFQLMSYGLTDEDIVKNLQGEAAVDIGKGSYKFIGYNPGTSTDPKEQKQLDALRKRRTSFKKAHATFRVKKGVMNTDDFKMESFVLNSHGKGWINLPEFTIDLSIQNDFVAVPSVTVRIKGDLGNPEVHIPTGRIVSDTVWNVLSLPEKSFNFFRDIFK